jgi:hypothetical protein
MGKREMFRGEERERKRDGKGIEIDVTSLSASDERRQTLRLMKCRGRQGWAKRHHHLLLEPGEKKANKRKDWDGNATHTGRPPEKKDSGVLQSAPLMFVTFSFF